MEHMRAFARHFTSYDAFVCGPGPFMQGVVSALKELEFPRERRHQEKFISLGGNPFGDEVEDLGVDEDEDEDAAAADRPTRTTPAAAGDDDEDEPDPDDVEADLDTILKDRIAANDDEEDEEEEEKPGRVTKPTDDDGTEGGNRVAPRKAGEFVCSSCFLVKPDMQLADAKKKLCLDCV
jgi:hypothetical protein